MVPCCAVRSAFFLPGTHEHNVVWRTIVRLEWWFDYLVSASSSNFPKYHAFVSLNADREQLNGGKFSEVERENRSSKIPNQSEFTWTAGTMVHRRERATIHRIARASVRLASTPSMTSLSDIDLFIDFIYLQPRIMDRVTKFREDPQQATPGEQIIHGRRSQDQKPGSQTKIVTTDDPK